MKREQSRLIGALEQTQVQRPAWLKAGTLPFRSRVVELDGCRIHFLDEGKGPPLLLLHGNPTWSFLYRDMIRELSPYFRCIAPDYPGFGLSTSRPGYDFTPLSHAKTIEQLVLRLDLDDLTLMVQDWGGPIGLWVAGRNALRFESIVIGNTWAWPVNGDFHFEWFSRFMGGPIGRFLITRFNLFVNALIPLGVKRHSVPADVLDAYRGPFREQSRRAPTHIFPHAIVHGRAFLSEVSAGLTQIAHLPALIVWGDKDFAFRAKERLRFESLFPEHQTLILRGAGHFIQEDAPLEIAEAILAWKGARRH